MRDKGGYVTRQRRKKGETWKSFLPFFIQSYKNNIKN